MGIWQRADWSGHPIHLGQAWTLRKNGREAHCVLVSHPLGWELRLTVGELVRSQLCRSPEEILHHAEGWKVAMLNRDWRDDRGSDAHP